MLFFLTRIVTAPFGADPREGTLISEEDIKAIIETGEQQGVLDVEERDMIHSVFALGDKMVHEVMVPRTDIVALEVNTPSAEVLEEIQHNGHSRLPIYEGSLDQIVGMVYVKDLFQRLARGERNFDVRQFVRPVLFVPETKKADELLSESYASIYWVPLTGLRFFTVYGPWGRPDMAMWIFTKALYAGEPLPLFKAV